MKGRKRVFVSLSVLFLTLVFGAAGFKFFGGSEWTLLDSIYMTVITLSTVGYGEIVDMGRNPAARVFAIIFIITCLGTIAFAVSSITAFIVEGELKNLLGRRKMEKEIARLRDHFIVCGSDETAQTIIQELLLTRRDFVVVEPSSERIEKLSSLGNILIVQGDPAEDDVLISAGIERARGILLSLPTDEANLFVTITARNLNSKLRIAAKGMDMKSHGKMMRAGADYVVSPAYIGGMRMVSDMIRPAVVTFLDMMLRDREKVLRFEEVPVEKGSPLVGKTLEEAKIGERTGALLVALRRKDSKDYEFNPPKETRIKEDDVLILIAGPGMAIELKKLAGKT